MQVNRSQESDDEASRMLAFFVCELHKKFAVYLEKSQNREAVLFSHK